MGIVSGSTAGAEAQRELYGSSWHERFSAIRAAYQLSQTALAATIGLSAPMVSQLASGQRTKIGNPSVLARVATLEERLTDPGVRAGDPTAIAAAIDEARNAHALLTTQTSVGDARSAAVHWLARHASGAQLTDLAEHARTVTSSDVAELLADAAHLRERAHTHG